jgi:hypothetical protein
MKRPQPDEFPPYAQGYVNRVGDDLFAELDAQATLLPNMIGHLPETMADYSYGPGKWTVRECMAHIIDTERIMVYRALRIGRNDPTPLPGFEQDDYVANADYSGRTLQSLAEEFRLLRLANLFLLKSFSEEEIDRRGLTSGNPTSVRGLLFIIAGHVSHHLWIFSDRYGLESFTEIKRSN